MKWIKDEVPPVKPGDGFLLYHGDIRLSVNLKDRHWQHFGISFGAFSEKTTDECKATWPREAIAEARRKLDEFEAEMEADNADN
jgi:hypothetical protein